MGHVEFGWHVFREIDSPVGEENEFMLTMLEPFEFFGSLPILLLKIFRSDFQIMMPMIVFQIAIPPT